jgi:hypothetical protein
MNRRICPSKKKKDQDVFIRLLNDVERNVIVKRSKINVIIFGEDLRRLLGCSTRFCSTIQNRVSTKSTKKLLSNIPTFPRFASF